nr:copper homeostasis protein CutC [Asaia prunellae]
MRPRAGDFVFSHEEEAQMLDDIAAVRAAELSGVVLGAALPDSSLDLAMLERLSAACGPLRRQLHRVFDLVPDPLQALEGAVSLGFERILTSGQTPRAFDGAQILRLLRERAAGRIDIMAGGGIRPETLSALFRQSGIRSFHASCRRRSSVQDERLLLFGFAAENVVTSAEEIMRLDHAIRLALH